MCQGCIRGFLRPEPPGDVGSNGSTCFSKQWLQIYGKPFGIVGGSGAPTPLPGSRFGVQGGLGVQTFPRCWEGVWTHPQIPFLAGSKNQQKISSCAAHGSAKNASLLTFKHIVHFWCSGFFHMTKRYKLIFDLFSFSFFSFFFLNVVSQNRRNFPKIKLFVKISIFPFPF